MTESPLELDNDFFSTLSEDELRGMKFSMPWQMYTSNEQEKDPDGFAAKQSVTGDILSREELQSKCWDKFQLSPQINTSVRGLMGRLTGLGFEITSEIPEINDAINGASH